MGSPSYAPGSIQPTDYIPNYLPQAILLTVLCCNPFAIVAIVFASQVNTKLANGDYVGAKAASDNAKLWCWISFGIAMLWIVLQILVAVVSSSN
jgi:hypothetical protein